MQTKTELIYNDVCTVALAGMVIYKWNQEMVKFWIFLFVYFAFKQLMAHFENYRMKKRIF